ncbi:MAG: hypothetical protein M5U24_05840 [Candidatus Kuenenia sp.]|uniref:hypothetical protein n=1 Tax=Candidatus Kuenenia sp. TaxID=2499824 RepID=UPI0022C87486|nr:hypothetical protein [Candidatus Kuenenia sp.]MCZ7621994.1 hypothetical protein [Candidatus Kuenenia sp.]
MKLPVISLKAKRNSLHPWIFNRMIRHPQKPVPPGTLVEVVSKEGGFIGRGIYNRKSNIGIRLLTENVTEHLCKEFILKKLEYAKALREEVLGIHKTSDCYRLVHGEADGLSGLIIDKFAHVIVVEPYSAGYIGIMDWIVSSLKTLYPDSNVTVRPKKRLRCEEWGKKRGGFLKKGKNPPPPSLKKNKKKKFYDDKFQIGTQNRFFS